ncbi:MAG: acyltransferase [Nitrospinales bacterium]
MPKDEPSNDPLFKSLAELRDKLDSHYLDKFNRIVPLTEALGNRWEKARRLGFGEGANIHDLSFIIGDVRIGENTYVGPYTFLDGTGGLTIGSNCSISAGVQIYSHDSLKWALSGGESDYDKTPVSIGSNCYIAPYVVISRGVTLGDHSIVGTYSLVKSSFPSHSIIMGTPAKRKGTVVIRENNDIFLQYDEEP